MTMSRAPVFPVEEKVRVVLSILAGELSVAEAARRAKVSEQSVGNWKRQFLEAGRAGLVAGKAGPSTREQQWEAEVADLTQALGEAAVELRVWKKSAEVLEGPSRPSADFFQTRSSTAASPNAWVRSATSASNCCSRVDGPALPATSPARPASRNCRFQFPTDCSETFARRAASATDNSPAKIDRTTRTFSSTGNTGALDMVIRLLQQVTTRNQRALPQSLTRDTRTPGRNCAS